MEDLVSFTKKINSFIKRGEEGNVILLNFLDDAERSVVEELTARSSLNISFSGGIKNADRVRCIMSYYDVSEEDYKIKVYQIIYNKKFYEIYHRSILGSLMSLGIKRECLGDIVIKDNKDAFFACTIEISSFIESEFKSVGKAQIQLKEVSFPVENEIKEESKVHFVSSLRLDAIIAAGFSLSRSEALEILINGEVYVNHLLNQNPSYLVKENEEISVRHFGKIRISSIGGTSKSGRKAIEIARRV